MREAGLAGVMSYVIDLRSEPCSDATRMSKRFFRRFVPSPHRIRRERSLRIFGTLLHAPDLWHLNRGSVSRAFAIGFFWALVPMPFQTIPAAASALLWRANLALAVGLTWISNPLTLAPLMYGGYRLGRLVLHRAPPPPGFEPTLEWLRTNMAEAWLPLYTGTLMIGVAMAAIGYWGVQVLWKWNVGRSWRQRKARRLTTQGRQLGRDGIR
jgi:uncharacterized protein (DUF2062 family)